MSRGRILVVDDEPDFRLIIKTILTKADFTVSLATTGPQAQQAALSSHPDLIVLDWNLPGMDGLTVCKLLKSDPATRDIPVILLTVRDREDDTVAGFGMGADDYISKRSLRPRELVARIESALRPRREAPAEIRAGGLALDVPGRRAKLDNVDLDLRRLEFDLLLFFLTNKGKVLTREQIIESVWGMDYAGTDRTVDSTLGRLRQKLGRAGKQLRSLRGLGYVFSD